VMASSWRRSASRRLSKVAFLLGRRARSTQVRLATNAGRPSARIELSPDLGRAGRRRTCVNARIAAPLCLLSVLMCFVPSSSAVSGPRPGRLIPVAGAESVVFGPGQLWVTTPRSLVRLDPVRHTVIARTRLPNYVASAAVDGKFVWVMTSPKSGGPGSLYSVSNATGRIVGAPIRLFPTAEGQVVVARGSIWVTNDNHGSFGRLFRIDPKSRKLVAAVRIPSDPYSVVYAGGSLWVGESDSGNVVRVDPSTGKIKGTPIDVGGALLDVAADRGKVWVAKTYSGRLASIDETSGRVISDQPLAGLGGVAASDGKVWTFFFRKREVAAVSGNQTIASKVRGGADGIVASGRSVWVINQLGITPLDP
jgi:streptogramin lyase